MMEMTRAESLWLAKLKRVLKECPSERIGFYTIGDHDIVAYDRTKEDEIHEIMEHGGEFGNAVDKAGAFAGLVRFPNPVHSTAG